MEDEKTTVYGKLIRETPLAYLIETPVGEIWLPKSQAARILKMPEDKVEIDIPCWLARAKGLE
jgi:hypothetical protein